VLDGHQDHRAPATLVPSIQTPRIDRVALMFRVRSPSTSNRSARRPGLISGSSSPEYGLPLGMSSPILLAVTVVGIPLALANFKLIPISLAPLGKQIVNIGDLRQSTRY